ncbi:MAG: hypothetical protein DCC88_08240 [Spirobacillus cienkowskii]|jgi:hypothetical protein|uniref:Uncharacterized protein n=1 Tax=Spirobacillus cienkowskii TaxID=495820 RepID=A0A369KME1_9BACT|nr:MAG: hypothetical protein DCC88_08240 [Spirobacillus cienkowskii]
MYLASLYVVLDLDPEIMVTDRDRVLRSLREKLKQKFSHRITVRADENEGSLAVALFDDNFERIKSRLDDVHEKIDAIGEARVRFHQEQIFCWYNGKFVETNDSLAFSEQNTNHFKGNSTITHSFHRQEKTIVYTDKDDEIASAIPSRYSRRSLRIPTRK